MRIDKKYLGIGLFNLTIGIIAASPTNYISLLNIILGCIIIPVSIQNA